MTTELPPGSEFDGADWYMWSRRLLSGDQQWSPPRDVGMYFTVVNSAGRLADVVGEMLTVLVELTAEVGFACTPTGVLFGRRVGRSLDTKWSARSLGRLVEELRADRLETFMVSTSNERLAGLDLWPGWRDSPIGHGVGVHAFVRSGTDATEFFVSAVPQLFEDLSVAGEFLLRLLRSWTVVGDGVRGGITHDHIDAAKTPYEVWYQISPREALGRERELLRGYFWANLLSADHIGALGGITTLTERATAAGLLLEPIPGVPLSEKAVLRLPGPMHEVAEEGLAGAKEVLAPVLFHRPYRSYTGMPLRIVKDPGTAYRKIHTMEPIELDWTR